MTTWITICDTCNRKETDTPELSEEKNPLTDGERLAALVEAEAAGAALHTRRVSCLMSCSEGCNVAIQAPGKLSYTLGRFEPSPEAAEAIVAYARLHAESASGQVPFRQWPEAVKGHFITRHPPLPEAQ